VFTVVSNAQSYQWQTDLGIGFQSLSNAGQYSGANSPQLSVSNVSISNNNQLFRCVGNLGNCSDTSMIVAVYVNGVNVQERAKDAVLLFPNPITDHMKLVVPFDCIGNEFIIYDILGNVAFVGLVNEVPKRIDLNLASGCYMLRLSSGVSRTFFIEN
jgi:hypothetical protein